MTVQRSSRRKGMTSVLAMIYLALMAALAIGFYSAIDSGSSITDNEQYIHHASTSAETALAFARYQLTSLNIPLGYFSALYNGQYTGEGGISGLLNGTANLGGASSNVWKSSTGSPSGVLASFSSNYAVNGYLVIPAPTLNASNVPTAPTWMSTDSQGGQAYFEIGQIPATPPAPPQYVVLAVAQNVNSHSNGTPITRKMELLFTTPATIFSYGLISYGTMRLNGGVAISNVSPGSSSGVMAITSGSGNAPINVAGANNSITMTNALGVSSPGLYWTNTSFPTYNGGSPPINWGSIKIDGFTTGSGSFKNYAKFSLATPPPPILDTSAYHAFCGDVTNLYGGSSLTASTYSPSATTLTNTTLAAGNYSFTGNTLTINGVLYLEPGANVVFNNNGGTTINGTIVQDNSATSGTIIFNHPVTQTSMGALSGPNFPAAETGLTGSFLVTPAASVTFNSTVNAVASVIAKNFVFNGNATLSGGSIVSLGSSPLIFNQAITLKISGSNGVPPYGVNTYYAPLPSSYQEVP